MHTRRSASAVKSSAPNRRKISNIKYHAEYKILNITHILYLIIQNGFTVSDGYRTTISIAMTVIVGTD